MCLTVDGIRDFVVVEGNSVNRIVASTTDAPNGQAVATRAKAVLKRDILKAMLF